jgi:hypothetical protein
MVSVADDNELPNTEDTSRLISTYGHYGKALLLLLELSCIQGKFRYSPWDFGVLCLSASQTRFAGKLSQGNLFEQKRTCTELAPCIDRDSTSCGKQENGSPLKSTSGAREHKSRRGIQESLA